MFAEISGVHAEAPRKRRLGEAGMVDEETYAVGDGGVHKGAVFVQI